MKKVFLGVLFIVLILLAACSNINNTNNEGADSSGNVESGSDLPIDDNSSILPEDVNNASLEELDDDVLNW